MLYREKDYVMQSLELHLFFARIMKEHSLFLKAGFTPVDAGFAKEAEGFKREFEGLLSRVVQISDGLVRQSVLDSGEVCTEFTAMAEQQTERFTGIAINKGITLREAHLRGGNGRGICPALVRQVSLLNNRALRLLDGLISLKERVLNRVLCCRMFTMNYPLLLEHIIREAKLYHDYVCRLEREGGLEMGAMRQVEQFWNQIMMEHALFIRGLLDPSEAELVETADAFAQDYARLLKECRSAQNRTMDSSQALEETMRFRDFKAAGAKGIQTCQIRSVILPLLADHVLREANHYLRLLNEA